MRLGLEIALRHGLKTNTVNQSTRSCRLAKNGYWGVGRYGQHEVHSLRNLAVLSRCIVFARKPDSASNRCVLLLV
jgi:hypothetical protein